MIYVFIIYIILEKAIYYTSRRPSEGIITKELEDKINFENFISNQKNMKIVFSFNKKQLLEEIKKNYEESVHDEFEIYLNNYINAVNQRIACFEKDEDKVSFQKSIKGENIIIDFNCCEDNHDLSLISEKLQRYYVARMSLEGLLFACLGSPYVLYSMASFYTLMKNHGCCMLGNIKDNGHAFCCHGYYLLILKDFHSENYNYPVELVLTLLKVKFEEGSCQKGLVDLSKIKENEGRQLKISDIKQSGPLSSNKKTFYVDNILFPKSGKMNKFFSTTLPLILRWLDEAM